MLIIFTLTLSKKNETKQTQRTINKDESAKTNQKQKKNCQRKGLFIQALTGLRFSFLSLSNKNNDTKNKMYERYFIFDDIFNDSEQQKKNPKATKKGSEMFKN